MSKLNNEDEIRKFDKLVDRTEWEINPQEVNAMYDPLNNDITFSAAIQLQVPFFSLNHSDSQNYGGIGVVIGQEI